MIVSNSKRSIMTLYSNSNDLYSHQVRIVLAEKGVTVDVIPVNPEKLPGTLLEINPYGCLPTLVDRDLVLYDSRIILEYLDERFPHPPLMPVYPVARAECRRMMFRIDKDWYSLTNRLLQMDGSEREYPLLLKELQDALIQMAPLFASRPYFLSEEFTFIDCWIAPLLWRLPKLGIQLADAAKPVMHYAERLFQRPSFKVSLSEAEKELMIA